VIPELLGELAELKYLYIESNNLSGKLPANLGKNGRLLKLDVYDNQLTGTIPPHLSVSEGGFSLLFWSGTSFLGKSLKTSATARGLPRLG
jgi:hypothetical protein